MNITQNLELKRRIIELVQRKATGTPCDLAQKLNVSKRNLYRVLRDLKDEEEIEYSRLRKTYYLKYV